MAKYIIKRFIALIPVLLGVTLIIFTLLYITPGDPALIMLSDEAATPEAIAQIHEELGLDDPFWVRYGNYVLGLLHGDLGVSYLNGKPVKDLLVERLPKTLTLACVSAALAIVLGVTFGVMRCMDILLAIPSLLLNLSIVSALGKSVFNMMLAVGISNIPRYCRIMRASVLQIKNAEYVDAARTTGASNARIILRHIIPNCLAPIIVQATLSVGSAIIACAGLSFLGVGIPAPTPEWGAMLSNGKDFLRHNTYITIFPGLAIMLTVLSLNLMGDGLRDAFDPKLRR